ncbi:MAG: hypothetical protein EXS08_13810 [Planctomycetes bacterium]|nr:hypothetical protein [Planctomycetota bacterium]
MLQRLSRPLALVAGLAFFGTAVRAQTPQRPVARALRTEKPPTLDGRLDDFAWQAAEASDAFVQVEPREGEPPSERTEIRTLFDADHLYLAIHCFDREPGGIIGTQMKRDADLDTDDRVLIVLDTFEDHRNGYLFAMNPAGAKLDALIANNGEDLNESWDAIWEGRATIDATGWSVEIALPFKSLSFRPELTSWGFNVQRVIKRRLENDRWASPRRNLRLFQVSEAGTIAGLAGIRQGLGLDVVPFFTTRWNDDGSDRDLTGKPGLDAFYRVSSGLGAALTFNTDFSDTEVDRNPVNLTRFPLFFPEKRDFFLQDAGIFQFADLGRDLVPFFSRRIGLDDQRKEVPILVGAKLTGRAGDYNLGVLGAHTEASGTFDAADLFVTRVSKNVGEQSTIGGILTHGDPNGRDANTVVGFDANFGTSDFLGDRNLRASAWVLESFDETADDVAFGAALSYPNDVWSWELRAKEIQQDFEPALGFVPRTGVRTYSAEIGFEPLLNRAVRRLEFGIEPTVVTNLADEVESAEAPLQFLGIVWDSGDELKLQVIPAYESLDQPFDIQDDVTIPVGDYDFLRWRVEAESALKRRVSGAAAIEIGDFFDGTRSDFESEASWRPSRYFTGEVGYEQNRVELPDGSFVTHQGTLRLDAAFSPDLTWSNFLQFDNEDDALGWNSRLQWILRPGQELNLVYNETLERDAGELTTVSQGAALKLQYTLRF